jgi:CheY-like chemotaxis protein
VLKGDPGRLTQVLTNLVANAIKFTEAGEIVIGVEPAGSVTDKVLLRFSVRDKGLGLSEAEAGKLFQPFTQVDTSSSRGYGGMGLGLALCKLLVEMLGGEIGVDSEPGQGSTFWFTAEFSSRAEAMGLPAEDERKRMLHGGRVGAIYTDAIDVILGARLLLVQEREAERQGTRDLLESNGLLVTVVSAGQQVVKALQESAYDLVFIDLSGTGADGYQVSAEIRKTPGFTSLPIVVATDQDTAGKQAQDMAAGVDDQLERPIEPERLFEILVKWIEPRARPLPIPEDEGKPVVVATGEGVIDFDEIRSILLELKRLLEEGDSESSVQLNLIEEPLCRAGFRPQVEVLKRQIDKYDFDDARKTLSEIAKPLNLSLSGSG